MHDLLGLSKLPHSSRFICKNVLSVLKQKIWSRLRFEIPVKGKLYIPTRQMQQDQRFQRDLDVNGFEQIHIASTKPQAVDMRMLVDISLSLYEWKGKQRNVVVLITADKDFGYLLSQIHKTPEVPALFVVQFNRQQKINPDLLNNIDHHLNDFDPREFITCPNPKCNGLECSYHHPRYKFGGSMVRKSTPKTLELLTQVNKPKVAVVSKSNEKCSPTT